MKWFLFLQETQTTSEKPGLSVSGVAVQGVFYEVIQIKE